MDVNDNFLSKNIKAWDKRTNIHICSDFYNMDKFRANKSSLNSIELEGIGSVANKSLLHLQCHFGQDTLSLAREGAEVTGVDFSSQSIKYAKQLSNEIGIPACFILEDVLKLDLKQEFDFIFTSYGVLGWLPDLKCWAEVVARHLKKGGVFYIAEFHPFLHLIDERYKWDYFFKERPDIERKYGSYTDGGDDVLIEDCWWNHSFAEIFESLETAGLKLLEFQEFDYSPYHLDGMVMRSQGEYVLGKRKSQSLPYVFTLKATKK
tara:strand:- start:266 stop:1054 length:789 start_codon:yes stop_codon:yes gene_type:complete